MLDDQVFAGLALLDAYEATLDRRYYDAAEQSMRITMEKFADPEGGGFFDRASDAAAMGGLDVRRKPFQDSPTPGTNSMAAILCDRMYAYSGNRAYHDWAGKTLEAFAKIAPQFGLFASSYALAAILHTRHSLQVVVTGAATDPRAQELERTANAVYRFGKAVLRVAPDRAAAGALAPALRDTIPNLNAALAQALVCVETTCRPPVTDAAALTALLLESPAASSAAL
jgi:uncharacterized protein YyaL (SSP411 family)